MSANVAKAKVMAKAQTGMSTPTDKLTNTDGVHGPTVVACTSCGEALLSGDRAWKCPRCGASYSALPGMVRINPAPRYAGDVPYEAMLALLARARQTSWLAAASVAQTTHGAGLADRIIGLSACDWFPEVPWREGMRALDVGSGWGQVAFRLCRYVKWVYSLEPVIQKVQFQQIRRQQQQAHNVTIVNSQVGGLPFRGESFDLIALGQTLESMGSADGRDHRPMEAQRMFLSRLRRLLKPTGSVYLTGANRLAFWPHGNHKGASRACIRSPGSYQRLLREAGFSNVRVSWVFPSCDAPFQSSRLRNAPALSFFARQRGHGSLKAKAKSLLLRGAARSGASRLIMPSIAVTAGANGSCQRSLLGRICDRLRQHGIAVYADHCLRCSPQRRSLTGRVKVKALHLLFDPRTNRPAMVVKIPRGRMGIRWLEREERVFKAIARRCPHLQQARRAFYMRVGGIQVVCERFFPGRTFIPSPRRRRPHAAVVDWLAALHRESAASGGQDLSVVDCAREVVGRLLARESVEPAVADYLRRWLDAISRRRRLYALSVPVHGDFTPNNVLLSQKETFVTDWDHARPDGEPWEDFWSLHLSCAFRFGAKSSAESAHAGNALACFTGTSEGCRLVASAAARFVHKTGIRREVLSCGLLATVVRRTLVDVGVRGWALTNSRYYQLLKLAADAPIRLWGCADRIVGTS